MTVSIAMIALAVLFLAYSNGANDNFKGVATLFGSGATTYRTALIWATITTLAGSLLALVLAQGLVDTFKGKGLVPDAVIAQPEFRLAVSFGAAVTVLLATLTGLPISTTHALTGGLVGAGLMAAASEVQFASLGKSFVLPLLFSPLLALLCTVPLYSLFRWTRQRCGVTSQTCICVGRAYEAVQVQPDGALMLVRTQAAVEVGPTTACVERYQGEVMGLEAGKALDGCHFLSSGAVGFARGLNDTPKIVALVLVGEAIDPNLGLFMVAVVMAIGGVLNARKVAETMSKKITAMNPGQGFTANLVTALLVTLASKLGMPVSTTHVSCGALFGIGVVNRKAELKTILTILLAWVTTLPLAAAVTAGAYFVASRLGFGG